MRRSIVIALLWALSVLLFWELGWSLADWPRPIGPLLAIAVGVLAFRPPRIPRSARRFAEPRSGPGASPADAGARS